MHCIIFVCYSKLTLVAVPKAFMCTSEMGSSNSKVGMSFGGKEKTETFDGGETSLTTSSKCLFLIAMEERCCRVTGVLFYNLLSSDLHIYRFRGL
ncbi:hypothetical protein CEXT_342531 [Caerostris extrusa]|uniref:Secreted protein n=1 Tax=Caerostris extrusa TaxID=172846 RepID=A0AAV4TPP8_CAEEX|nr:hypothetical protein CEXT_342531 [Caerostris extrusa]